MGLLQIDKEATQLQVLLYVALYELNYRGKVTNHQETLEDMT